MQRYRIVHIALSLACLPPSVAGAQALNCRIPATISSPKAETGKTDERRVSEVVGYTLALSWSPEYCFDHKRDQAAQSQCNGQAGKFGFILHGLWPEGATAAYPQWCKPAQILPEALIKKQLCVTPSPQLIQHEWAKHGVCASNDPARYLGLAAALYGAIRFPDMEQLSRTRLTSAGFAAAFTRANPGITQAMLRIEADDKGWLKGVRLCLDTAYHTRACPAFAKGANSGQKLRIARIS